MTPELVGFNLGRRGVDSLEFLARLLQLHTRRPARRSTDGSWWQSNMKPIHTMASYGIGVAFVGATVLLRMATDSWLGDSHPYTLFFAAITLTAWCAGFGPSLVAIVLSYLAGDWFFAAPRHAFDFENFAKGDLIGLCGFFFAGLAITFTTRALNAAKERAEARQQMLVREVAERKRVQQELEIAQAKLGEHAINLEHKVLERTKALEQSFQSLESVLYHVTHDLRGPLRGVRGLTEILLENYAGQFDETGRDYARQILNSADSMDSLIKDLLAYGRLGHVEIPLEEVDPQRPLNTALNLLSTEISARHGWVEIYGPLAIMQGNESVLRQVLLNLVCNALTYISPGESPHIQIWTEHRDENVRLCVKDHGIGIEPKYHRQIFDVFERLHRQDEYPGTGIGLAVVAKGIERMGGRVGVESELNKGSTFWIELPQGRARLRFDAIH